MTATESVGTVELRVIDRGNQRPRDQRTTAFLPFQCLGHTDNQIGTGRRIALSHADSSK